METQTLSASSIKNIWKWVYALSLPIAIVLFFLPNSHWGAMDEGEFLYQDGAGAMSWWEHLSLLFLPQKERVFLFGTFRPLPYRFYFKLLTSMGVSAHAYNYFDWVGSWLACIAFAWGIWTLVKRAIPVGKEAMWMIALLTWWTPTWVLCTNLIYPDCWMQPGLMGVFWALVYGKNGNLLKLGLGVLAGFLACQSHEATIFMLGWTTLWIFLTSENRKREWEDILIPVVLAVFYILIYRSLNPGASNRPEIQISYVPIDMAHTARYYLLIGLNAISKPFLSYLSLNPQVLGQGESNFPVAFILCLLGTILAFNPLAAPSEDLSQRRIRHTWILIVGGLICTIPYFVMKNRSLVYYGLRLQIYIAALIAIRAAWGKESQKFKYAGAAIFLYLAGSLYASNTLMYGWNWAKHYGGVSKSLYDRVMQIPGASECSTERPCCLEFSSRGWVYNETTVNWNDGAPYPPRFLKANDSACTRTLKYEGPYGWGW